MAGVSVSSDRGSAPVCAPVVVRAGHREEGSMRFSIYSEMQLWPPKTPERLYAEVQEQIVHADRLGYDAYAIVEHFFFPRFSVSPDPLALFAQVAPRTQRIRFRTMLHCLPFHNPTVLASRVAVAAILTGNRYE